MERHSAEIGEFPFVRFSKVIAKVLLDAINPFVVIGDRQGSFIQTTAQLTRLHQKAG